MVELKNDQTAIAMCGILKRDSLEHPDIGFALLPAFTGNGYAVEIAHATLNYAIDKLNLKTINAIVVPANRRSIHLLEKIGLRFVKTIAGNDDGTELMLFSNLKLAPSSELSEL
jgi:RimJ/RimL family protein N-acetyltransferase